MTSSETFFMLFTSFITLLFLVYFKFIRQKKIDHGDSTKLPTGPKKLPIIGNLHQLGKLPHRSLQNLSKKYGELMFLKLGSVPTLVVSSTDMAGEIFKAHDLVFSGRPSLYAARKLSYDCSSISFAPYGEYWRQVRKIAVSELMTAKRVKSFGEIRAQEVALMVNHTASRATNLVNLSELAFDLSNNVVSRVAFGMISTRIDHGKSERKFQEILAETQHLLGEFNVADYFPRMGWLNRFNGVDRRLYKNIEELDEFWDKVIKEHVTDHSRPAALDQEDIIDVLLRVQKDPDQTISLTNEQLKGVLVDVFVAGTDTSAATIVWTMAELVRNLRVKTKAQQEVREVAKGKAKVEESDLPKIAYLKLVIKESWRLHPPAPLLVPRETTEDCTINQTYEIPAKTRVIFNASAIGTDPKHWENPEEFWPERFMSSHIDFRGQHFELLPFGAGRRGCPGINFAVPLVELALANFLFCFDWELPEGMTVEDIDMEEAPGITMHKKSPLCLMATPVMNKKHPAL